eukprot:TRINITY_DN9118_c0_g1_i1.p1 TRINITY_DN9118_c0_g1~~TRINITY_DN9118_c0_g1_i1.p1  ORF type:complete len:273 (-),score=5.70 TRINITY_DN9118_c0_g1_i1:202-1020(-)
MPPTSFGPSFGASFGALGVAPTAMHAVHTAPPHVQAMPAVHTAAPHVQAVPAMHTARPAVRTHAPAVHAAPHMVTTAVPAATTAVPVVHTAAPVAPVVHHAAPHAAFPAVQHVHAAPVVHAVPAVSHAVSAPLVHYDHAHMEPARIIPRTRADPLDYASHFSESYEYDLYAHGQHASHARHQPRAVPGSGLDSVGYDYRAGDTYAGYTDYDFLRPLEDNGFSVTRDTRYDYHSHLSAGVYRDYHHVDDIDSYGYPGEHVNRPYHSVSPSYAH